MRLSVGEEGTRRLGGRGDFVVGEAHVQDPEFCHG
jgi:hypothetical protein